MEAIILLFLSSQTNNITETQINECSEPFPTQSEILWSNWGNGLYNQRVQAKSSLNPQNINQLELKWAFGFNDSIRIRSQPLVTEDTIYIGSQSGQSMHYLWIPDVSGGVLRQMLKSEVQ